MKLVFKYSSVKMNKNRYIVTKFAMIIINLIPYIKNLETEIAFWNSNRYFIFSKNPYQAP